MTADGVERSRLIDFDNTTAITTNKYIQWWDTNRTFPVTGSKNLEANYTTVAGDYLVMEFGSRSTGSPISTRLMFGDSFSGFLANGNSTDGSDNQANPWIEFSTNLSPTDLTIEENVETFPTAWTPPSPVKHFGIACWPQGVSQIPDDVESRAWATTKSDIGVHVAAESLIITKVESETDIYELATEFRLPGGGNAIGPYHALLVGNARQQSGPGTPRAAITLDEQALQIDTERRTHTVWDTDFTVQQESLSAHAVRALVSGLRQVDATDIPSLSRTNCEIANAEFAGDVAGWSAHSGGGGWTSAVTHDPDIGGDALGSIKFAVTSASAGTWLYHSNAYCDVASEESVEVTAWMHQTEAGSSSPRIGIAWYDGSDALVATTLDQFYGISLDPAQDRVMRVSGTVPSGAVKFRVLLGVTVETDVVAAKWFDDIAATIFTPQHYDASLAKVTEEMRASRWLPLVPPRRTVVNGAFDSDISGWELYDDGAGITQAASHDASIGGYQDGSLKVAISANSGNDSVVYLNAQPLGLNGQESETIAAWVRTDDEDLVPRLCIAWYTDPEAAPVSIAMEAAWEPQPDTGYSRAFGAIAPPEAGWFRVGFAVDTSASATGACWLDDVTLNDNDLLVADTSPGELDVAVIVRPRFIP